MYDTRCLETENGTNDGREKMKEKEDETEWEKKEEERERKRIDNAWSLPYKNPN